MAKKAVLAYSGGLDTSVSIKWLEERYGYEVITVTANVGGEGARDDIEERAAAVGAAGSYVIDGREEFVRDYVWPTLKANGLYEGRYPLSAALSRPYIAKKLVETAEREGAEAVAHGCTGKGNDQVRFDVSVAALNPDLKIVAPVREWGMSRDKEMEYARKHGIQVPVDEGSPYSVDENIWGKSIECGVLEDPWTEPPEEIYTLTRSPQEAPAQPEYLEISFEKGEPVAVNGRKLGSTELLELLNETGGRHGVGRLDMVENRLVGIKSREIYEAPAAVLLIEAHRELERLTLPRETAHFKPLLEQKYAELVYFGLWYSPLKAAIDAFIEETQKTVSGTVRLKLYKGKADVVGREAPKSLYDYDLATYEPDDAFDHEAAEGFINIWGLPTRVYARVNREGEDEDREDEDGSD